MTKVKGYKIQSTDGERTAVPDPSLPSNAARRVVIFPLHCLSPLLRFLWIAEDNAAGLPARGTQRPCRRRAEALRRRRPSARAQLAREISCPFVSRARESGGLLVAALRHFI